MTDPESPSIGDALNAALTLLREASVSRMGAGDLRAAMEQLQRQHPALELDLAAAPNDFDGSQDLHLLIAGLVEGTVSMAYDPPEALPWPLRGLQRWSNDLLGTVDGHPVTVGEAMVLVECLGTDVPVIRRIVDNAVLKRELRRRGVRPDDREVAEAAEALRRTLGLYRGEAFRAWLGERGMSEEVFLNQARDAAALQILRRQVVGAEGEAEAYFRAHPDIFATVTLALSSYPDEGRAREALQVPADDSSSALPAVLRALEVPEATGVLVTVTRSRICRLPPEQAEALTNPRQGDRRGPLRTRTGWVVAQVLELAPARFDDETRRAVEDVLFGEWLSARRRAARIQWYWGNKEAREQAVTEFR
jgi:putative peptide maturation system protein